VHGGVLQRAHDLGRDHVARDAHDEQLAEVRVEQKLGRHARIAAADDGGVGLLLLGELGEDFLLYRREARAPVQEALISRLQTRQRLVRRIHSASLKGKT
jgi:hypothetical protein